MSVGLGNHIYCSATGLHSKLFWALLWSSTVVTRKFMTVASHQGQSPLCPYENAKLFCDVVKLQVIIIVVYVGDFVAVAMTFQASKMRRLQNELTVS